ncbi:MAG: sigma-70 family RNA polymerase sigma factor [Chloroflexi bacterium]|nr:sigma-70 family RNA polymerase sigma factor [Chloroflexota bacterium]
MGTADRATAALTATSSADGRDEADLVCRAIHGDTTAFGNLYSLHVARVYRHCYFRSGDRAEAEDFTQQTFLQAWRALNRYRQGETPFVAWLLAIAHNVVVSAQRRSRIDRLPELAMETVAASTDDPERVALLHADTEAVRHALRKLKPDRQQVVVLRFFESMTVEEVASLLRKTPNHVRVLQHRALADLRRHLTAGL